MFYNCKTVAALCMLALAAPALAAGPYATLETAAEYYAIRDIPTGSRQTYRPERLPRDLQSIFRDDPEARGWLEVFPGDDRPRFRFGRLRSPDRSRHFVFLSPARGTWCSGSAGCPVRMYERVDAGWRFLLEFSNAGVILGEWRDWYPTLLTHDALPYRTLHWWEEDRYRHVCVPPTEPWCREQNSTTEPQIFLPRAR